MTPEEFEARTGQSVSHETLAKLERYVALLVKWTSKINLISASTIPQIWDRHILDSAQLFWRIPAGTATKWVDFGSGGGLPAVVLAILAQGGLRPVLMESDLRKATFLRQVASELSLGFTVLTDRIETAPPQGATLITARAFAPLNKLLPMAARHLQPEGRLLLLKGAKAEQEIAEARQIWDFTCAESQSITQPEARILQIDGLVKHG